MKKTRTILLGAIILLVGATLHAQDSTKHNAFKQISKGSENADNLYGKKIQQQTLSKKRFEKLDTIVPGPVKKKNTKHKHHNKTAGNKTMQEPWKSAC